MIKNDLTKPLAEKIIRQGWPLLDDQYTQEELRLELERKGLILSPSTISNIYRKYLKDKALNTKEGNNLNPSKSIGRNTLLKFAEKLLVILKVRKNLVFDFGLEDFISSTIENTSAPTEYLSLGLSYKLRIYEEGRRSIADKIEFIKKARHEVIEMGIRLNTFSKYFIGRNDSEFKDHIVELLGRGVELKCLMMHPKSNLTQLYFADRAKANPRELNAFSEMPQILEDLQQVRDELNSMNLPGKMKIWLYENFPYHYYLTVDGDEEGGKMMYSSYIYGEKRANCPVIELYKYGSLTLYQRHWNALQLILAQAIEV